MWAVRHKSGRVLFVTSDEFIADNRRNMGWIVEEVKMTSREQFEEWFSNDVVGADVTFPDFEDGEYIAGEVYDDQLYIMLQAMWLAWQASRAEIEIELPEPCSPGDFCVDIPAQAHHEVVEAIEQAGLKVKK